MKKGNLLISRLGIVQAIVLISLIISAILHGRTISEPLILFFYQFFVLFLSGYVLSDLLRIQGKSLIEIITVSYAMGIMISIVTYMIAMLLGLRDSMGIISIAEAGLSFVYICLKQKKKEYEGNDSFHFYLLIAVLAVYFLIATITVSCANIYPDEKNATGTGFFVDWPFWTGNNITFTKGFPATSFRSAGVDFRYHYFSSILLAQISLSTGIDIVRLTFYYSSVFGGILLSPAVVYFSTRLLKSKKLIILAVLIILFTDNTNGYATLASHTVFCPFGFDYGYAYGMITIGILIEMVNHNRWKEFFISSVLFLGMTTGNKGPIGLIVLAGLGFTAIYYICHKQYKIGIVSGLSWLFIFLLVFFLFIYAPSKIDSETGVSIAGINERINQLYDALRQDYRITGNHAIIKIAAVWLYLFRSNNVILILTLYGMVHTIIAWKKKNISITMLALSVIALTGIVLMVTAQHSGNSQMYFYLGMYPYGAMTGLAILEENREKRSNQIAFCLTVLLLGISISSYYTNVQQKAIKGLNAIRGKLTHEDYRAYYADSTDFEAFEWLRNHTEENALVACDSFKDYYEHNNSMIAGIFSERYIWNEKKYTDQAESERRNEIVDMLYTDCKKAWNLLENEKIDYLLHSKKMEDLPIDRSRIAFENEHYIIYALSQR